jgi:ATP-dependent Clp protease ATP-binding subunit ClpA
MFERFTDGARRIIVLAQEEARAHNHDHIGTEHLLLGVLRADGSRAGRVLQSLGISPQTIRAHVEEAIGRGPAEPSGHIPFTAGAKKALELSLREALRMGQDHIGTEHILLGLMSQDQGVAARVLGELLGADLDRVRRETAGAQPPVPVGKFTVRVRRAIALADQEAISRDHDYIGTEHILVGLLREGEGVGAKALTALGITLEAVLQQVAEITSQGRQPPPADSPAGSG